MSASVQVTVSPELFLRDPQETKLGKSIIEYGIALIDEIGLEKFTFKKLASRIGCTEASIYRYFENKHKLLLYLVSWYWEWVNFRIDFNSMNVSDPKKRLVIVIRTIVDTIRLSNPAEYVDRDALHRVVVTEGTKAYHINNIDEENEKGYFITFKKLVQKVSDIILELKQDFPYPHAMASNLLEMANNQRYFAEHLPLLTDIQLKDGCQDQLEEMLEFFAFRILGIDR